MRVFENPIELSYAMSKHYLKNEEEMKALMEMATKDWYAHEYVKSGYLWGEVSAIIIWGNKEMI